MGINKDAAFVDMLYRSMDQNRDNKVTLEEYLWYEALVLSKQTAPIEYLIEHTFQVYDKDGNGYIEKSELYDTILNIYRFNGSSIKDSSVKKEVSDRVDKIMKVIDENHDGKISQDEMLRAYRRDPNIFELF
jgi:Ca2+-binding EF-hand superfamily protein